MSRDSQEQRVEVREALTRELRQFQGLSASIFRLAAARAGMTVTDMQVLDTLQSTGPLTAGQLADLTGLTTGAITGMLNRLEESGFVRRERDPSDGRRVIVRLVADKDSMRQIGPMFDPLKQGWEDITAHYNDEQLALLLEFLQRNNALSTQEIVRLREAPEEGNEILTAPLGDVEHARLVVSAGVSRLTLRAKESIDELYQARFEGPAPDVKVRDGVVAIRYPRRLLVMGTEKRTAEVTLNATVTWEIVIQGAVSTITTELGALNLSGLEVKGSISSIRLYLPMPTSPVPVRISGGASDVIVRRPAGVPARVHLKGWASQFVFDEQSFSNMGNDVRLQSPNFDPAAPYYDIEVASSVSMVTITAD